MRTPHTLQVPPYGEIKIAPNATFAFLGGNAPYVILRTGSDSIRVDIGNCVPVSENYCALVNPFPRAIEILIARGMEPFVSTLPLWQNSMTLNLQSGIGKYRAAQVTGLKYAIGVMLKRGAAQVEFLEGTNDGFSKVMIFSGAKKDFLSFKPAGCMEEAISMRFSDGKSDESCVAVSGTYTQAMIDAWISAASYSGQITEGLTGSHMHTQFRYMADTATAVFFVRDVDKIVNTFARVTHLGAGLEEFR